MNIYIIYPLAELIRSGIECKDTENKGEKICFS